MAVRVTTRPRLFKDFQIIKVGVILTLLLCLPTRAATLSEGDTVPRMVLSTASGKKIDVNHYAKSQKKKNLLLVLFRTGTCPVCVSQLTEIAENYDQIKALNAVVLAVSLDDAIVQARTSEKIGNAYPILLDPDAKTINAFGTFNPEDKLSRPSQFLIGQDQKILFSYVGKSVSDRPSLQKLLDVLNHYSGLLPTRDVSVKPR
jgi:peroxiredoxin